MAPWHEDYRRRYEAAKKAGLPFFPYAVFKDAAAAAAILAVLSVLALWLGAPLEDPADPADTAYNPRPEWYFLFLFQALKFFPGSLEAVAAVILPGAAFLLLALVPFLDRGPRRHPLDRPRAAGLGLAALAGFGYLTWAGQTSPLLNPAETKDPAVVYGRRLYGELNCAYCHSAGGKGGSVGPALDQAAGRKDEDWLIRHFRDPQSLSPGSPMPKLNLLEDEIRALVAYLKSLEAGPFTPEAPKLFAQHCAACHRLGREGGDSGPGLGSIGLARDKAFLKRYILDPSRLNPDSLMPGYREELTDLQAEDLARYLANQKENGP